MSPLTRLPERVTPRRHGDTDPAATRPRCRPTAPEGLQLAPRAGRKFSGSARVLLCGPVELNGGGGDDTLTGGRGGGRLDGGPGTDTCANGSPVNCER